MPYITPERRRPVIEDGPKNAGELNYALTLVIHSYWERHQNYQGINDIVGALEGAKVEFQRRVVAPYEDGKIQQNGDIHEGLSRGPDVGNPAV